MAQDRLLKFTDYNVEFKVAEGHYFISLIFKKEWILLKSEYQEVKMIQKDGMTYFIAPLSFNLDTLYDVIDGIIEYNKEIEMKCDLIRSKIQELQELFATESYERLQCLQFVIKNKKGRPTTKRPNRNNPTPTVVKSKKKNNINPTVEAVEIKTPHKKEKTESNLQNVPVEIECEDTNGLEFIQNV